MYIYFGIRIVVSLSLEVSERANSLQVAKVNECTMIGWCCLCILGGHHIGIVELAILMCM